MTWDLIFTYVDVSCLDAWSTFHKFRRKRWPRDFCGFVRVSSNYTVWWSDAGKICTQIHTLGAFYDGNQTDGRHYRFALPQTFWQILDFSFAICHTRLANLSLTPSLTFAEALNPFLKCVLNGLLTWCSCNPRFFCLLLYGNVAQVKKSQTFSLNSLDEQK